MNNLILAAVLISCFFLCVSAFIWGIKIGKSLTKGDIPTMPIKRAVDAVKQKVNEKKVEELSNELDQAMNYSYDTALSAIKKGGG